MQAIVALQSDGGIGYKNDLPWPRIKEDMKFFRDLTLNNRILVGKKTYESMPPIKNRIVHVLNSKESTPYIKFDAENHFYVHFIKNYHEIKYLDDSTNFYLCGGASIYKQFLPLCQNIYITHVKGIYEVDTYFPFSIEEIRGLFPFSEKIKELPGGHEIICYSK